MLGNDIVDLKKSALESNWQRKGFLDKIFTKEEQQEIWTAPNPEIMVWLFWSMKEAVYKIINRESLERFYSPQKFECKILFINDGKAKGAVVYNETTYFTESDLDANYIYTLAHAEISNLKKISTHYLCNATNYKNYFKLKYGHCIQKNLFGVPEILDFKLKTKKPVSISHHGRYLAIAY